MKKSLICHLREYGLLEPFADGKRAKLEAMRLLGGTPEPNGGQREKIRDAKNESLER